MVNLDNYEEIAREEINVKEFLIRNQGQKSFFSLGFISLNKVTFEEIETSKTIEVYQVSSASTESIISFNSPFKKISNMDETELRQLKKAVEFRNYNLLEDDEILNFNTLSEAQSKFDKFDVVAPLEEIKTREQELSLS